MSKFSLWWDAFKEADMSAIIAVFENQVVGFQSINSDGETVKIKILPTHQTQGIAATLMKNSGSYRPERTGNENFWEQIKAIIEAV
jgi:hypothetical protein